MVRVHLKVTIKTAEVLVIVAWVVLCSKNSFDCREISAGTSVKKTVEVALLLLLLPVDGSPEDGHGLRVVGLVRQVEGRETKSIFGE